MPTRSQVIKETQGYVEEVRRLCFFKFCCIYSLLLQDSNESEGQSGDEYADGFSSNDENDEDEGYSFVSHVSSS